LKCLFILQLVGDYIDRSLHVYCSSGLLHDTRHQETVGTIIACFWCVALGYGLIPVIIFRDASYHKECIMTNPPAKYVSPKFPVFVISLIILIVFYLKIVLAFRRKVTLNANKLCTDHVDNRNMFVRNRTSAFKSAKFFAVMCGV
jgi:hypothetical protein